MSVLLKKTWFNPLYFHLRHYVDIPTIRRIMVYGGKSSAKTMSVSQLFIILCYIERCNAIAYRKEQTTIKITLKPSLAKAIETTHFGNGWKTMDFKFSSANGNEIVLKGLDEEGKVKGVEGFKYLMFDELDHFTDKEWEQANLSLRGMPGQKLFATWNPVSERSWIKKYIDEMQWDDMPLQLPDMPESKLDKNSFVRLSKDGKTLLIKTTYHDNKWTVGGDGFGYRDENLIAEYERLKKYDENSYNVNVLGLWGKVQTGMEFYHAFKKHVHVDRVSYIPELPVHLTFDFNVLPYMTMLCCQVYNGNGKTTFRFFKEYCLKNPDNSSRAAAQYFIRDFSSFKPVVFYYGDATGKNRIAGQGNKRNFDDIEAVLLPFLHGSSDKVLRKNPNIFKARDFMNLILGGYWPDIEILVDESCTELIADLENVKVSIDGKAKDVVRDKALGISYQKYGHTSDAMGYLVISVLYELYMATSANG